MQHLVEIPENLAPPPGSLRDRDNRFYQLLAGGARTRLLEGFLDLKLPELLGSEGPLTAAEICLRLKLDPHRGWKFLHLLALAGLLDETGGEQGDDFAIFGLSGAAKGYFGEDGRGGYFFRDLVNYWRNVAILPLADVLEGMPLPEAVRWPPPGEEAAIHLETWMRVTADGAIKTLLHSDAMLGASRLLDVGGGDATIGCCAGPSISAIAGDGVQSAGVGGTGPQDDRRAAIRPARVGARREFLGRRAAGRL